LKGLFSVVYQDFVKHSFTLRENCAVGNVALLEKSENDDEIYNALHMTELSELTVKLPNGIHTNLGKIHADGVDLSGGQWQRLAMSRAIISPAPVRILDEPTAALDPISESRIYELFGKISHNALTIFISHRLGSTKIADEILVFSGGTVKEQGSYEILMENKGLYYEMFEQQRSWYQ
jgi:ATP-binding cassette subfamily B protein